MKILANPALLRAMVVLFCAGFAFLIGVLFIRFLRQQIAEESDMGEDTPRSLDALPLHVYNTVIQQLKQQKHELMIQSQAEQQRTKSSEALNQAVLANVPCGVLIFGPNGLVRSVNPAAKTILGFATMIGMSAEDILRGALVRKDGRNAAIEEPVALAEEVRAVLHEGSQRRQVEGEYETPGWRTALHRDDGGFVEGIGRHFSWRGMPDHRLERTGKRPKRTSEPCGGFGRDGAQAESVAEKHFRLRATTRGQHGAAVSIAIGE